MSEPTCLGYPIPPRRCPSCGGRSFRGEGHLWVCTACTPEGTAVVPHPDPEWQQRADALHLLNRTGVRYRRDDTGQEVRIPRAVDSPEVREAVAVLVPGARFELF